jgi:hypothetical protein
VCLRETVFDDPQILHPAHAQLRVEHAVGIEPMESKTEIDVRGLEADEAIRDTKSARSVDSSKIALHELHVEVAVADVEDNRHRRPERADVGEILLRSDAKIDPPWFDRFHQIWNHVLKARLVRQEVVGSKKAVLLEESFDKFQNSRSLSAFGGVPVAAD